MNDETPMPVVPVSAAALHERVLAEFTSLSPRLQQVGRHVLDEPNDIAFETLTEIASRCRVQPSTIVRFAQYFGFTGASPMQKLLRDALLNAGIDVGYVERLRRFGHSLADVAVQEPGQLLGEFVEGNVHALHNLSHAIGNDELSRAIELIEAAPVVFVIGFRRSFPVASYFAYLLSQAAKRVVLVDGIAGLAQLQLKARGQTDLVVAISFTPYAGETIDLIDQLEPGTPMIAISDSVISPIAKPASIVLQVRETEIRGFRSLAASMCLVQALAIGFGAFHAGRFDVSDIDKAVPEM